MPFKTASTLAHPENGKEILYNLTRIRSHTKHDFLKNAAQ